MGCAEKNSALQMTRVVKDARLPLSFRPAQRRYAQLLNWQMVAGIGTPRSVSRFGGMALFGKMHQEQQFKEKEYGTEKINYHYPWDKYC